MRPEQSALIASICVLSDSRLFRETIGAWLSRQDGYYRVAAAGSLAQLRRCLDGREADVLLAHARADGALGTELLGGIRTLLPATRLIVLESRSGGPDLVRWIESGAAFYLNSDSSAAELMQCVRSAANGGPGCSVSRHTRVLDGDHPAMWKAARSQGHSTAVPLAACDLAEAIALPSGVMRQAIAAQRHCGSARRKNSSLVPYP